jgi:hypothetical protein
VRFAFHKPASVTGGHVPVTDAPGFGADPGKANLNGRPPD